MADAAPLPSATEARCPTAWCVCRVSSGGRPRRRPLDRGHGCPHCGKTLLYPLSGTTLFCPTSGAVTYEIGQIPGTGQICARTARPRRSGRG